MQCLSVILPARNVYIFHHTAKRLFVKSLRIWLVISQRIGPFFKMILKALFWQHDTPTNTPPALHEVVNEARSGKIDLNVYILRYSSISEALVKQGALSTLERVSRLLDGLSDEQRKKVLNFCVKKKWRLSAQDVGKIEPVYSELKEFVLREAEMHQALLAYGNERILREGNPIPEFSASQILLESRFYSIFWHVNTSSIVAPISTTSPQVTSIPAHVDSIADLSDKFAQLTLILTSQLRSHSASIYVDIFESVESSISF